MDFWQAAGTCFSKYATFEGRASRAEFWHFALFCLLANLGAALVIDIWLFVLFSASEETVQLAGLGLGPAGVGVKLAVVLPLLSALIRRLHDVNHSGWALLGFTLAAVAGGFFGQPLLTDPPAQPAAADPYEAGALMFAVLVCLYFMFLICIRGSAGENRFGAEPMV